MVQTSNPLSSNRSIRAAIIAAALLLVWFVFACQSEEPTTYHRARHRCRSHEHTRALANTHPDRSSTADRDSDPNPRSCTNSYAIPNRHHSTRGNRNPIN